MMPRLIVGVITLGTVLVSAEPVHAQNVDEITLEDIWAAFRAREEQVETAKVTWKYRLVMSEYSVAETLANEPEGPEQASDIVFPEQICRLSIADQRLRYESPIAAFAHGQGGRPTRSISAFDGSEQQFFAESLRPEKPHYGSLRESDASREWNAVFLLPVTSALRPLRAELFGPEPGEWRILDDHPAVIDGRQCVVLELQHTVDSPASGVLVAPIHAERVYLDPEHGFRLLRRTALSNNDQVVIQVDARYEEGDAPDWFPTSWNGAMYGAVTGRLRKSSENRLVSVFFNEPIPDSEFRIKFPPGTEVTRSSTPYDWQKYVVSADGQLVPASPRVQLKAPGAPESWWHSWRLLGGGIVLLALAVVWGAWRIRSHA